MDDYLIRGAIVLAVGFAPITGLILARNRLGELNAAAGLVVWAALVLAGEHGNFAITLSLSDAAQAGVGDHSRFHFFMAGAYTLVAAVLLLVVAWTLLRRGQRAGWFAILLTFLLGGAFELVAGTTIFPHGFPGRSIPLGLFLYAYLAALGSALWISYRPIFGKAST
jgi:hypothetical protein